MFQFGRNPFHRFAFEKREQDSKTLNAKVFFRAPARLNGLQMAIRKWPVKWLDNSRLQRWWSPIRLKPSICGRWGLGAEACWFVHLNYVLTTAAWSQPWKTSFSWCKVRETQKPSNNTAASEWTQDKLSLHTLSFTTTNK